MAQKSLNKKKHTHATQVKPRSESETKCLNEINQNVNIN